MTEKTEIVSMRTPFPARMVNKLPKGTKAQNDCPAHEKVNCAECGGWHHPKIKHLDYVGHAALTDRLLDVDINWNWEPLAFINGLPAFDESGGLWIRLTVGGTTRIGYGHAAGASFKDPGAREKEVIGDALRNAAMRFGAALDLWFKGNLHEEEDPAPKFTPKSAISKSVTQDVWDKLSPAQQSHLQDVADTVSPLIDTDISLALGHLDDITDPDEKVALWNRFNSKERSAIKRATEDRKVAVYLAKQASEDVPQ